MKKKYIFAGVVVLLAGAAAVWAFKVNAQKNIGVAAKVNGEIISVEEIRKGYTNNPQIAAQISFNDFYDRALDIFVNGKLLYQAAQNAQVESTEEYQDQFKTMKEDLTRKIYLEKIVAAGITDEEIRKLYDDEYLSKFESKKEFGVKHIMLDNEETAMEVLEKLNEGADFDTLAKEYTKDTTVDLGYVNDDLGIPEFIQAVQTLKKGQYTKAPVKTQFGYHIIWLNDVRDSQPVALAELEPQIRNLLAQKIIAETLDNLYKNAQIEKFDLKGNLIPAAK
ncbi:MAG: peptidyl-prolyl cis-trans isomerase [Alphaproteobacteria bacterium]|nr:peptidyl-prolyl cis-trans isomerase [Alphaproteobacteria bacterium]